MNADNTAANKHIPDVNYNYKTKALSANENLVYAIVYKISIFNEAF